MTLPVKNMEKLTPDDFMAYPVWELALDLEEVDDLAMRPVPDLPVDDLRNRTVGTQVRLANGTKLWAVLGNIFLSDPQKTKKALVASFYIGGNWIPFSPKTNATMYGSGAIARRLGLKVEDVFPVSYDVGRFCVGDKDAMRGTTEAASPQ
jgi:hypothetical protein